jgi:predicted transcriptional regulator
MSTLTEIKSAIEHLNARDRAILTAELFAIESEPGREELEAALQRGLDDVAAGRVRSAEEVRAMIPRWTTGS